MLAIVIPYYKKEFFEDALVSLANQTNKNFKIYIGDDSSPEDPMNLIRKYNKDLKINYTQFPFNLGGNSLSQHWGRCISLTGKEEWIMILGDDDKIGPSVVDSFYRNLPVFNEKSNLVRFSSKIIFEETNTISKVFSHPRWENAEDSFIRRLSGHTRSSLSEYIFSKEAYLKSGFRDFGLGWHSDDLAWLEFSDGKPIYSINEATVFFRISDQNITGKKSNENEKTIASRKFYKYLSGNKSFFSKEQRLLFARKYERNLRAAKGKLSYMDWLRVLKLYLLNFEPQAMKKTIKRLVRERWFNSSDIQI